MGLRSDIDDVREQIYRERLSLLTTDVRVTIQKAKLLLADFLLEQKFNRMMRAVKANFNPAQLRVPAGNSDGGRWTDEGSSWDNLRAQYVRSDGINDRRVVLDANPGLQRIVPYADYAGVGHHYPPRAVFKDYPFPPETRKVFEKATTWHLHYEGNNAWNEQHMAYNDAVRTLFRDFFKRTQIEPSQMTPSEAEALVKEIMDSKEPRIRNFNRMVKLREVIHSYRKRFGFRGNE